MESLCHRCGNALEQQEPFCPHCGAPQFLVETPEAGSPQQAPIRFRTEPNLIQWRTAIVSALIVAVPVGVLSALTSTSSLFVLAGSFATLALYRRRGAFADIRIGWRVGALLGAASSLVASASWALWMLIQRYLLHNGAALDKQFTAAAQQGVDMWMKAVAQQGPQPDEVMHAAKSVAAFLLSPDGHAAMQLSTALVMSISMLLCAAIGGSLAGWLQSTRSRAQRTL